jgi:hypothetical protein
MQAVKEATKRARASGLDAIVAKLLDVEFSEKLARALAARNKKAAAMLHENLGRELGDGQQSDFTT